MIKAGAAKALPAAVGAWTSAAGSSGPGTIYTSGNSTVIVSFLAGAKYAGLATNVTRSVTKAGTGVCGSTSEPSNLTCYLATADGVLNLSADAGDTPLPALVSFAGALTARLGTA
ncbi:hypothetical protein [Nakamurella endophytica]|uniref:Uncharacterized protein n=1 Tax=Nakamurella endophytica TaxID=1748367 RepID=A0A917WJD0_9ACTN|nr:hypothetical protein [Nakamurella endophytica]GGM08292.1 hypothetical protein GCM10011594_30350 [Nakamurella endophytica]